MDPRPKIRGPEVRGPEVRGPEVRSPAESEPSPPAVRLDLLAEAVGAAPSAPIRATPDVVGVSEDSRRVRPGFVFFAVRGHHQDGLGYVDQAIAAGAVAVVADRPKPAHVQVPWLVVPAARQALAVAAAYIHGQPVKALRLDAVTGSKGKTTTAFLAAAIAATTTPTALCTTIECRTSKARQRATLTTASAPDLQAFLRTAVAAGDGGAVVEVSSHALDQDRVFGLPFEVAVFTNLFPDHLDYHGDLATYFAAKRRLFVGPQAARQAVVGIDDEHGQHLAAELSDVVTFGRDERAMVRPLRVTSTADGIVLVAAVAQRPVAQHRVAQHRSAQHPVAQHRVAQHPVAQHPVAQHRVAQLEVEIRSPLLGRHHVANLLAGLAYGHARGLDLEACAAALGSVTGLPGRLEPVRCGQPFLCLVDFAHTGPALEASLRSVREFTGGKIIVVFGAGGERDPARRSEMGQAAARLADITILTDDNPRHEDPEVIVAAIAAAFRSAGGTGLSIVRDRAEAIAQAIALARPGDTVLVAGKGHEREQLVGDRRLPFADVEVVRQILADLGFTSLAGKDGTARPSGRPS